MKKLFFTFFSLIFSFSPLLAQAIADLNISPTQVKISPDQPNSSLTLENQGDKPALLQISYKKWVQKGNKDQYQDSKDLLVMPPIVSIPPQESRVLRIGLSKNLQKALSNEELTYRIFIQEVAPTEELEPNSIQTLLTLSLPVFITPPKAEPELHWNLQVEGNALHLEATNSGHAYAQIANVTLKNSKTEKPIFSQDIVAYILAHNKKTWVLPLGSPSSEPIPDGSSLPQKGASLRVSRSLANQDVILSVQLADQTTSDILLKVKG